jgi:hypothetical protein
VERGTANALLFYAIFLWVSFRAAGRYQDAVGPGSAGCAIITSARPSNGWRHKDNRIVPKDNIGPVLSGVRVGC